MFTSINSGKGSLNVGGMFPKALAESESSIGVSAVKLTLNCLAADFPLAVEAVMLKSKMERVLAAMVKFVVLVIIAYYR